MICVGNVNTRAGAGKTPIVRELLLTLTQRGVNAHGLSRGYGGRPEGSLCGRCRAPHRQGRRRRAPDAGPGLPDVGLGRPCRRGQGGRRRGAQAIVMDDGHQNPTIKKALSLVVVDGETRGEIAVRRRRVFPAGPMREPLKVGLSARRCGDRAAAGRRRAAGLRLCWSSSATCRCWSPVWKPPPLFPPARRSASPASASPGRSRRP
ncbi:tetraacyldisaccharide 4'-kinase [Caulobacter segnis]